MGASVSVLVPAHNDGPYLEENLRSLQAQTFRDFEAVIADDGSSDDTPEIAGRWARLDSRFRLSRVEVNLGMNRNWNRALREASGDYVLKLDADDAMTPGCLAALVSELERAPAPRFAACRTLDCDANLEVIGPFLGDRAQCLRGLDPEARRVAPGWDWLRICFDDIQLWTSNALMFPRQELESLGGWDERWTSSDTDLILRALATPRPVAHVPAPGILYRRRAGSSSERHRVSQERLLELSMIHLRALSECREELRPWDRRLRQNWWRYWAHFESERARLEQTEASGRETPRSVLELAAATARCTPPVRIRIEGWMRAAAWRARKRLFATPGS